MPDYRDIFAKNWDTLTHEQQKNLQQKRVCVVGCGGLGGYVIEQLVRLGVGHIDCFDPDLFSISNCNRQLNATSETIGQNKAEVAARRSEKIHPFGQVVPFPMDFRKVTDPDIFGRADAVVDCLDNVDARRDLSDLCSRYGKALVYGAVSGWTGQAGVQLPKGDLYRKLYPRHIDQARQKPPSVLSFTVALVAGIQVSETLKILLAQPSDLADGCLIMDLKNNEWVTLRTSDEIKWSKLRRALAHIQGASKAQ